MKAWTEYLMPHLMLAPIMLPMLTAALMLFLREERQRLKLGMNIVSTSLSLVIVVMLLRLLLVALLLLALRCFLRVLLSAKSHIANSQSDICFTFVLSRSKLASNNNKLPLLQVLHQAGLSLLAPKRTINPNRLRFVSIA